MAGLEPGYQLGHYRITRSLGSGGMADVYEAQDDHLDRTVALKVLPMEYCRNPQLVQRFQKEVRAAAKLNHRNIVTVFEVGQQDSWHFFSMRLLTGGDLRRRIDEGMTPVEALAILREVADAFAHAHARGFVHRDVKPENIMFDEQGFPVLTDFGIAKALDANTHMTRTGMTMGTPRYLSPEQASGKPVDARADLYSLGIILHEMLTGRPPYEAEEAMAVIFKHVTEPVPILPPDFVRYQPLLEKLMAKDAAKRIASAADLIGEIDALVPKTPTGELKQSQLRTAENPLIAKLMTPSPLRTPAPQTPRPVTPPPMTPAPLTPVPQAPAPPTPVVREMTGEVAVQAPPAGTRQAPLRPPTAAPRAEPAVRPPPAVPARPAAPAAAPAAPAAGHRFGAFAIGGGLAAAALAGVAYLALKTPEPAATALAPATTALATAAPAPAQPEAAARVEVTPAEAAKREQTRQQQLRQQAAQKESADLQARLQAEVAAKQRAEQEAAQKQAATDLQARQQAEAETRKRAAAQEQAEARQRAEADAAARRRAEQQAQDEARRKAAADAARQEEEVAVASAPAARAAVPVRVTIVNDCRSAIELESVGVDGTTKKAGTLRAGVEKGFDSTESAKWRMFERSRRRPLLKEVTLTGAGQRLRVCDTAEAPVDSEEEAAKERARRPTGF